MYTCFSGIEYIPLFSMDVELPETVVLHSCFGDCVSLQKVFGKLPELSVIEWNVEEDSQTVNFNAKGIWIFKNVESGNIKHSDPNCLYNCSGAVSIRFENFVFSVKNCPPFSFTFKKGILKTKELIGILNSTLIRDEGQ